MSLPPYQYLPLPSSESIRVIILLPAVQSDTPLRCELVCKLLSDPSLRYEAISYACGDSAPNVGLEVNGNSTLLVTELLSSALRCFRDKCNPRYLWVDAISINQYSVTEKEQQVGMMRYIYPKAQKVLLWLGEADEQTKPALELCDSLASRSAAFGIENIDPMELPHDASPDHILEVEKLSRDEIRGKCLVTFLFRPCFWRRWIVQEIILATDVLLHCGDQTIDWITFSKAVAVLRSCQERRHTFGRVHWLLESKEVRMTCYFNIWHVILMRAAQKEWKLVRPTRTYWIANPQHPELGVVVRHGRSSSEFEDSQQSHALVSQADPSNMTTSSLGEDWEKQLLQPGIFRQPRKLLEQIQHFATSQVSDPRDMIYSLLGIAEDEPAFEANYGETVKSTYLRFARYMLLQHHDLSILHHIGGAEIPSYAPDWRSTHGKSPMGGDQIHKYFTAIKCIPRIYASAVDCGIFIGGTEFDIITHLVPFDTTNQYEGTLDTFKVMKFYREAFQFVIKSLLACLNNSNVIKVEGVMMRYGASSEPFMEALAYTFLCGNQTREVWSVFPEHATKSHMVRQLIKSIAAEESIRQQSQWEASITNDRDLAEYLSAIRIISGSRSFFVTSKGYIGIAPNSSQVGDRVVALFGAETPFILRKVGGQWSPSSLIPQSVIEGTISISFGDSMEATDPAKFFFGDVDQLGTGSTPMTKPKIVYNDISTSPEKHVEHFRLLGDCYLHGFMDDVDFSEREKRYFKLV